MILDEDVYLEHYGKKGMRWGVRNDGKTSASQKNSMHSLGSNWTPDHTIIAVYGGVIAAGILARKATMYMDSGRKDAKKSGDKAFAQNPKLSRKMSVSALHSEVVKPINPGYGAPGTKMNCRRATFAYEMRRRGNDVKATQSKYASGQNDKGLKVATGDKKQKYESVWGEKDIAKDVKGFAYSSPQKKADTIFTALSKQPNGSRGELGVAWSMGGGHSVAWEIVNRKPIIFDTQNGNTYNSATSFAKFTPVVTAAAHTRLDNKTIDSEFIKRWVTNV